MPGTCSAVRSPTDHAPFPPRPPPPPTHRIPGPSRLGSGASSVLSSASDSSSVPGPLRLLDFQPWSGIATATADQMRSPKFRRIPFERDGVFDHGGASVPRLAGPHILPSALSTASASAKCAFRGSITHPTQSLCTLRDGRRLPPRNTRYRAPAMAYSNRTSTGWNAPASWRSDSPLNCTHPTGLPA